MKDLLVPALGEALHVEVREVLRAVRGLLPVLTHAHLDPPAAHLHVVQPRDRVVRRLSAPTA